MAATTALDALGDWVDADAIQTMIESVRAAYATAPGWVQIGLLVMLAIAVVVGILRIAASLAGRLVITAVIAVIAVIAAGVWSFGAEFVERLAG